MGLGLLNIDIIAHQGMPRSAFIDIYFGAPRHNNILARPVYNILARHDTILARHVNHIYIYIYIYIWARHVNIMMLARLYIITGARVYELLARLYIIIGAPPYNDWRACI